MLIFILHPNLLLVCLILPAKANPAQGPEQISSALAPVPGCSLNGGRTVQLRLALSLLLSKFPGHSLIPRDVLQNMHPLAAAALLVNPHRNHDRAVLRALRG